MAAGLFGWRPEPQGVTCPDGPWGAGAEPLLKLSSVEKWGRIKGELT